MDLYREVKNLPNTLLVEHGFQRDKLAEGFFCKKSDELSIVFHVTGGWSYVGISSGVRFASINNTLYKSAIEAGWPKERAVIFQLELVGLFWEKMGDFCASSDDIGEYCPSDSTVASILDIFNAVLRETIRLSQISTLEKAVEYVCERELFEPFGAYMVPAAAKTSGNEALWACSLRHFSALVPHEDRPMYTKLLDSLENM